MPDSPSRPSGSGSWPGPPSCLRRREAAVGIVVRTRPGLGFRLGVPISRAAGESPGPEDLTHQVLGAALPGEGLDACDGLLDRVADPLQLDPVVVDDRVCGARVAVA